MTETIGNNSKVNDNESIISGLEYRKKRNIH